MHSDTSCSKNTDSDLLLIVVNYLKSIIFQFYECANEIQTRCRSVILRKHFMHLNTFSFSLIRYDMHLNTFSFSLIRSRLSRPLLLYPTSVRK